MKFNQLTYNISFALLIITALYTLLYAGLAGILLCTSVSLITAAFVNQFEIVVAISVIFALTYIYYLKPLLRKMEPFENQNTPQDIVGLVKKMKSDYKEVPQNLQSGCLPGVYDPAVEGFANPNEGSSDSKEGAPSDSSSAPTTATVNQVDPDTVAVTAAAVTENKKNTETAQKMEKKKEDDKNVMEAMESASGHLFKLGKMPSETADGPMVDAGSTLMKAMNMLKPDQVKSLSSDSKQLLDTQRGLMDMLKQMQPVLSESRQLMDTFSTMFGGGMKLGA
jgi:hypothetical protein